MKVLFAVSNDNITTSVVSKYQQTYKEIITSKNVYYFNAIIKELQNDKTYDAIVIGEDLEPVANNNYEAIDKFLIEKLDRISDEASKPTGEDIPIIFICAERRTKSSQLLLRLFSMSIYDALVGNDRSVNKVCALINKPRSKKEAKRYYQIETDQAEYEAESDELVSEEQIQNILNYYKKIGTNEKKCVEAFDSIAKQYDDTQLRIIVKFLPMSVKAILEINSQTYQQLMTGGTVLSNGKYNKYKPEPAKNQGKLEFLEKDLEKTKLSEPVVIPETMNLSSAPVSTNNYNNQNYNTANNMTQNVQRPNMMQNSKQNNVMQNNIGQNVQQNNMGQNSKMPNNAVYGNYNNYMNNNNNLYNNKGYYNLYNQQRTQNTVQNIPQNISQNGAVSTNTQYSNNTNNVQYNNQYNGQYGANQQKNSTYNSGNTNITEPTNSSIANDLENRAEPVNSQTANGLENRAEPVVTENSFNTTQSNFNETPSNANYESNSVLTESSITPPTTIDENNSIMAVQPVAVEPVKRGRGRPRKTPLVSADAVPKVKRGRGRPRKTPLTSEENINATSEAIEALTDSNSSALLMDNAQNTNNITPTENETTLPGLEPIQDTTTTLPGMEPVQDTTTTLPGVEPIQDTGTTLPGIEPVQDIETTLPGMGHIEDNGTTLSDIESIQDTTTTTSGLEPIEDNTSTLPGIEPIQNTVEEGTLNTLPGIDSTIENAEEMLPGVEEQSSTETILPGIETPDATESALPGAEEVLPGVESTDNILPKVQETNNTKTNDNILPQVEEINENTQEANNNSESENGESDMNNFNQNPYGNINGGNNPQNPYGNGMNNNQPMYKMNNFNQNPYGNNPQNPYGNGMGNNPQNPYGNGMGNNPQNPYGNGMGYNPQNPYGNGGYNPQNPYGNGGYNPQNPYGNGMGYNPQNPYGNGGYNPQNPYDNGMNNNQNPFGNENANNQNPFEAVPTNNNMQEPFGADNQNMFDNNSNDLIENIEPTAQEPAGLVVKNGKIALFVGTTKNGTSFIVNNLASMLSESGVNTAIVDLTKNRNAYYMFTDNKTELMQIAANSLKSLQGGEAKGIEVNKNLTVFTGLPDDNTEAINPNEVIQNVSTKYEVILLDCDFDTDSEYYKLANEIYLVQSMDAFTIQPLTKLLSDLKNNNMLDESKLRVIINKHIKTSKLDTKMIIGGMSKYNEPSMTLQRDIFNPDNIKSIIVSFEEQNYIKYIEDIAMCHLSLNGYTKGLIQNLEELKGMVYPLIAGNNGGNTPNNYNNMEPKKRRGFFGGNKKEDATFSNNVNNTLNKMRTNY